MSTYIRKSIILLIMACIPLVFFLGLNDHKTSASGLEEFTERLTLKEPAYLHNEPSTSSRTSSMVQPQTVTVSAQQGIWLRINTWQGPKWINPPESEPEEVNEVSKRVEVAITSHLHDQPLVSTRGSTAVQPQTVTVTGEWGSWYRINTWQGPKWIESNHVMIEASKQVELAFTSHLHDQPLASTRRSTAVQPQTVTVTGEWGSWYRINTWVGPKWIESNHVMTEASKQVELAIRTDLHDQPSTSTRRTSVQPQTVTVTGKWGSWYRINSWLGSMWIHSENIVNEVSSQLTLTRPVYLHNQPSPSTRTSRVVQPQVVNVTAEWQDWYRISTWVGPMWIHLDRVASQEITYGIVRLNSHESNLNVRSSPNGSVIGSLGNADVVEVINREGNWHQIRYGGISSSAYVSRDYIETFVVDESKYTVFIDAGHGGHDPGAVNNSTGTTEKEIVLQISNRIIDRLENDSNFNVVYTRRTDRFDSLSQRTDIASGVNADVFLSVHANAYNGNTSGTETYYYKNIDRAFAEIVHGHLIKATGLNDKGLKYGNFHVIRESIMPAALIEIAFVDNISDERLLTDSQFQDRVARSMHDAIKEYSGH